MTTTCTALITVECIDQPAELLQVKDMEISPSDDAIKEATFKFLEGSDLVFMTRKELKIQLENLYGWNLDLQKDILKKSLQEFMTTVEERKHLIDDGVVDGKEEEIFNEEVKVSGKKRGGFGAAVQLSDELSQFLGHEILPRTEVTKLMWNYIKEHNLQNPENKREILCDAAMELLFKKKKFTMFKMTKYLSEMMKSIADLQDGRAGKEIEAKTRNELTQSGRKVKELKSEKTKKEVASGASGSTSKFGYVELDPALSDLLGGAKILQRTQVPKLLWEYIKEKQCQNPVNRKEIICDEKMQSVFKKERFTMFEMTKLTSQLMQKTTKLPENDSVIEVGVNVNSSSSTKKRKLEVGESSDARKGSKRKSK